MSESGHAKVIPFSQEKKKPSDFATNSLISGENPAWIAKVIGHRNTEMIIKVYLKYMEDLGNTSDGTALSSFLAELSI